MSSKYTKTPSIHTAISSGDLVLVEKLLSDKSEWLNKKNSNKRTPLHVAAINNNTQMLNLLLSYGPDADIRDFHGNLPLHASISHNNAGEVIKRIIAITHDLNVQDRYGNTPLHLAVEYKNTQAVKWLLEANVNPNIVNNANMTPLSLAQKYKRVKIRCLLVRRGAKKLKTVFETIFHAIMTVNIFKKGLVVASLVVLIGGTVAATIFTNGALAVTILEAIFLCMGISILSVEKQYRRIRNIERNILNGIIIDDVEDIDIFKRRNPYFKDDSFTLQTTNLTESHFHK